MSKIKPLVLFIASLVFLISITYFSQIYLAAQQAAENPSYFGPPTTPAQENGWWSFVLVVLFLLLGIFCNYLFERAKLAGDSNINLGKEIGLMLHSPKFIMALVIAPLTFNSVYVVIGNNPHGVGDYLLAFQNGFFWQSIISGVMKSHSSSSQDGATTSSSEGKTIV